MPPTRSRTAVLGDERGFTFIEVLVVIIIIGVLAAIALPMFLKEKDKASDADAKNNASLLVTHVESCNTDHDDFTRCDDPVEIDLRGLDWGSGPGQVSVTDSTTGTFTVVAVSEVETSGTNHTFMIERDPMGSPRIHRECTVDGQGGCPAGGLW